MAQPYDLITKETLQPILLPFLRAVLGVDYDRVTALPEELQKNVSRRVDLLFRVEAPAPFVLQVEFQKKNQPTMARRMLVYAALIHDKLHLPVQQLVIYLGKERVNMPTQVVMPSYTFEYQLIDLKSVSYRAFLDSPLPGLNLFAILGNFGGEDAGRVLQTIPNALVDTSADELEKYLIQFEQLAELRNSRSVVPNLLNEMALKTKQKTSASLDLVRQTFARIGREEGQQIGQQIGREGGLLMVARKRLAKGDSPQEVQELTGLPLEKILALQAES